MGQAADRPAVGRLVEMRCVVKAVSFLLATATIASSNMLSGCSSISRSWPNPSPCTSAACADVMIVIDVSRSTTDPWPEQTALPRPASILDSEIQAARRLVDAIASKDVAVGVIAFSGGAPDSGWRNPRGADKPAWTEVPLTDDFSNVRRSILDIQRQGANGFSHTAAAVDQGTIELLGFRGARSVPREGARAAIVVLTDGVPTLPYDPDDGPNFAADNIRTLLRALDRARRGLIEIYLVGIGPDATMLRHVEDAVLATNGMLTLVLSEAELLPAVDGVARRLSTQNAPIPMKQSK